MDELGPGEMPLEGAGSIRKQELPCHNQIEWDVGFEAVRRTDRSLTSPAVEIGNQWYVLEFSRKVGLHLDFFRMGPYVDGPAGSVHWWAGWKLDEKIYHYRVESGDFFLSESQEFRATKTLVFSCLEMHIKRLRHLARDGRLTFFVRMTNDEALTEEETCTCSLVEGNMRSTGRLTEDECSCHKQVDWEVDYKLIRRPDQFLTSPAFKIGNQFYVLEFHSTVTESKLEITRMGPCVDVPDGSLRFWSGSKFGGVICHRNIVKGELRLAEMCEIRRMKRILNVYRGSEIEKWQDLLRNRRLAFFIRVKEHGALTGEMMSCAHRDANVSGWSVGRIDEEDWTSYKHVEWNLDFDPTSAFAISPVFTVGTQSCLLELSNDSLGFFRMGPFVGEIVRCWMTVKDGDPPYHPHGSVCSEMCLRQVCELWKRKHWFTFSKVIERKRRLIVDFVMILNKDSYRVEPYIHDDVHAPVDSELLREGYVFFHVKDKVFKMHRAILRTRVPVMAAMFQHDCVENRTGVVHIEDCEPEVFQTFLEFVFNENQWNVVTQDNAFDLYVLADRYLLTELKTMCLRFMENDQKGSVWGSG